MTYFLQEYPAFDGKSSSRIILGTLTLLGLLGGVFYAVIFDLGPPEYLFGAGIPGSFLVTYIAMSFVSKIFLKMEAPRTFIELSAEKIILRTPGMVSEIQNRNLKNRYVNKRRAELILSDESGKEVILPRLVMPEPGKFEKLPVGMNLNLFFDQGQVFLKGRSPLVVKRFPFISPP